MKLDLTPVRSSYVAPTFGGLILDRSGNDWNLLLYLMVGAAAVSASCWLFFDLDKAEPAGLEKVNP